MRTTLVLDDALVREAKHRAVDLNLTLGEFVNRALRDALRGTPDGDDAPFSMPTFGAPGAAVRHEPGDLHAVLDDEDGSPFGGD